MCLCVTCSVMSDFANPWTAVHQFLCLCKFLGKNTGQGCHFLLQGILSTQRIEPKSPTSQAGSLWSEPPEEAIITLLNKCIINKSLIYNFIISDYVDHLIGSFQHPSAPFHSQSVCSNSGFCKSCLSCRSTLLSGFFLQLSLLLHVTRIEARCVQGCSVFFFTSLSLALETVSCVNASFLLSVLHYVEFAQPRHALFFVCVHVIVTLMAVPWVKILLIFWGTISVPLS